MLTQIFLSTYRSLCEGVSLSQGQEGVQMEVYHEEEHISSYIQ